MGRLKTAIDVEAVTATIAEIVGKAPDGSAATGNPVLFAGKYNATPAEREEGDVVTVQTNAKGSVLAELTAGTQLVGKMVPVDADGDEKFTADNPAVMQLSGSIPEYGWIDGDTEPTPDGFAFGAKVDPGTGSITTMYWNGTAWVEVE